MATRTTTQLHGTYDDATKAVRTLAAGGPHANVPGAGSGHGGVSGVAGGARTGRGRGAGIGATLGTLAGAGAGLMAGIGALPLPGAGPVVAAGWLVAVLTGAGVGAGIGAGTGAAAGRLLGSLTGAGGDGGDADVHAEGVRRGGTALPAQAGEAEAAGLESALADGGGGHAAVAPRRAEHRAEGWNRFEPAAAAHTASGVQAERKRRVRVYDVAASAAADAEVHRNGEAVQQAGSSAGDAPRRGAEVTGDAARRAGGAAAGTAPRIRVYGARAMADAAVRRSGEAVQQAGSSAGGAPRQGAEVTAGAARQGGEARAGAARRVRVHDGPGAADAALRRDAEAVQQGCCPAGDTPRQGTEVAADAARRGAEAGAEGARRDVQAVADSQRRIAQDVAEPVEEVSREAAEAARDTTEEARRMAAPLDAAEGGPRGLQQGAAGLFEGVVRTNLRVAQELVRLSDPAPVVELQQRFAREYTDAMLQGSAALVRAVRRTADETLRPLERQVEQRGGADGNGPRSRPAAE